MDEQQKPAILGYRELTKDQIDLMNEVKQCAKSTGELLDRLRIIGVADARWLSIGQTQLQQGFMAVTRSIAQPEFF